LCYIIFVNMIMQVARFIFICALLPPIFSVAAQRTPGNRGASRGGRDDGRRSGCSGNTTSHDRDEDKDHDRDEHKKHDWDEYKETDGDDNKTTDWDEYKESSFKFVSGSLQLRVSSAAAFAADPSSRLALRAALAEVASVAAEDVAVLSVEAARRLTASQEGEETNEEEDEEDEDAEAKKQHEGEEEEEAHEEEEDDTTHGTAEGAVEVKYKVEVRSSRNSSTLIAAMKATSANDVVRACRAHVAEAGLSYVVADARLTSLSNTYPLSWDKDWEKEEKDEEPCDDKWEGGRFRGRSRGRPCGGRFRGGRDDRDEGGLVGKISEVFGGPEVLIVVLGVSVSVLVLALCLCITICCCLRRQRPGRPNVGMVKGGEAPNAGAVTGRPCTVKRSSVVPEQGAVVANNQNNIVNGTVLAEERKEDAVA
jgi:hypothetical protein